MSTVPLTIISIRTNACMGEGGHPSCEEFAGPWKCRKLGPLRNALTASEPGLCPRGLHPDADAVVSGPAVESRWRRIRDRLATGLKGWMFYATRRCPASADARAFRRSQCGACPHRRRVFWMFDLCEKCGCLIRVKTAIASAQCPLPAKRWAAVKAVIEKCRTLDSLPILGRWFKTRGSKGGCCG